MLVIDARREAQALLLRIGQGEDPLAELEAQTGAPTMVQLWDRYDEEHMAVNKRPRSQVEDRTMWSKYIEPAMGHKKVEDVTVEDVTALFNKVKRSGLKRRPSAVVQLLSTMFNLAIDWTIFVEFAPHRLKTSAEVDKHNSVLRYGWPPTLVHSDAPCVGVVQPSP